MSNSYRGFNNQILTFQKGEVLTGKSMVTLDTDGKAISAKNQKFIGVVDSIRGDVVGVQMEGYVEVDYDGTAPTYGNIALKASATDGKVSVDPTGTSIYRVLHVDTTKLIVGFIL